MDRPTRSPLEHRPAIVERLGTSFGIGRLSFGITRLFEIPPPFGMLASSKFISHRVSPCRVVRSRFQCGLRLKPSSSSATVAWALCSLQATVPVPGFSPPTLPPAKTPQSRRIPPSSGPQSPGVSPDRQPSASGPHVKATADAVRQVTGRQFVQGIWPRASGGTGRLRKKREKFSLTFGFTDIVFLRI